MKKIHMLCSLLAALCLTALQAATTTTETTPTSTG